MHGPSTSRKAPRTHQHVHLQVEEAVECYHRLQVATALESTENQLGLSGPRRAAIAQAAAALQLRMQVCMRVWVVAATHQCQC